MIKYLRTNSQHADYKKIIVDLDVELSVLDGDDHAFYAQFNKSDHINQVVLVYSNENVIGCGAFKFYDEDIIEMKRMFVVKPFRNKGIASAVLFELEKWATELNFSYAVLETGKRQPDAIALYLKNAYKLTANYGQYMGIENSVCFKKGLNSK